jgi:hypothetical protein
MEGKAGMVTPGIVPPAAHRVDPLIDMASELADSSATTRTAGLGGASAASFRRGCPSVPATGTQGHGPDASRRKGASALLDRADLKEPEGARYDQLAGGETDD